ncbi:hypothetical protein JL720_9519 [Aureococcus anophagefferens]|nr:hypothetical protein JL720_9519 [Aureococcus anophagefferens]
MRLSLLALFCTTTTALRAPSHGTRPLTAMRAVTTEELVESFGAMKAAAGELAPFSQAEVASVVASLANDWAATEAGGAALAAALPAADSDEFARIFEKVLGGGGWAGAVAAAESRPESAKPWVVLVTGVNGIRKTTSIYEPWFGDALREAIVGPGGARGRRPGRPARRSTSFFRQLDFVIATAANEDFRRLYGIEDVAAYAAAKDAIFSRYRTVAEMVGALLVAEAKTRDLNVMLETSGRDVAMFEYVDHFFPDAHYRKLALNFEIEDLAFAESGAPSSPARALLDQTLMALPNDLTLSGRHGQPRAHLESWCCIPAI